ncbi:MAG TPA: hypothetical protein VKA70_08845 [Blastocatellia bacterium]|nr:hypothetical protein [Blastocatellia bacterium]
MSSDRWAKIQDDLDELASKPRIKALNPLVETLKQWATAQPPKYQAEFFELCIRSVNQMDHEIRHGHTLEQVIDKAQKGEYTQSAAELSNPEWTVETVNQAQTIFNIAVTKTAKEIEEKIPDPGIKVPVLLLVMNVAQAEELEEGKAFEDLKDGPYADQFTNLRGRLDSDWVKRYKRSPEDWQPFQNNQKSIKVLVTEALSRITGFGREIIPDFVEVANLTEEGKRAELRRLREQGCVVIMDAISMRHLEIQRTFRRALLDAYPNMFVVRLAPSSNVLNIDQQMIRFRETYLDLEFHKRLTLDLDDDSCEEVYQEYNFVKWLVRKAKNLIPAEEKAQEGIRKYQGKSS